MGPASHGLPVYARAGRVHTRAGDALVLGLVYWPPGADAPIRETARLTRSVPAELRYPVPPDGASGLARLSAVGTVGGRLVQARDLSLPAVSEDLFLLSDVEGVRIVSRDVALAADPD